jgi:hypothetical protein
MPAFIAFRAKPPFNSSLSTLIIEDDVEFLQPEFGERALPAIDLDPRSGTGYFTALAGLTPAAADAKASRLLSRGSRPGFL